jgi:hypothetical protein
MTSAIAFRVALEYASEINPRIIVIPSLGLPKVNS